jgi:hypothetical protein
VIVCSRLRQIRPMAPAFQYTAVGLMRESHTCDLLTPAKLGQWFAGQLGRRFRVLLLPHERGSAFPKHDKPEGFVLSRENGCNALTINEKIFVY